jgi:hypothetical protein
MMKLRGLTVVATIGALSMLATSTAFAERLPGSAHGGKPLAADLAGSNETPPNATTATGSARITVNTGHDEVCWEITFNGLATPATAAHIHIGAPGVAGMIVLATPVPPVISGTGTGCATVDDALARAIRQDPGGYYVNVHDSEFPAGQIRGQLH